jgi:hypothetical protein
VALPLDQAEAVRVLRPCVIEVTFRDGTKREIDLEREPWGPVFEPLRNPELFAQAAVDPLGGSVYWPTGADLAPEFLYYGEEEPPPGSYQAPAAEDEDKHAAPIPGDT